MAHWARGVRAGPCGSEGRLWKDITGPQAQTPQDCVQKSKRQHLSCHLALHCLVTEAEAAFRHHSRPFLVRRHFSPYPTYPGHHALGAPRRLPWHAPVRLIISPSLTARQGIQSDPPAPLLWNENDEGWGRIRRLASRTTRPAPCDLRRPCKPKQAQTCGVWAFVGRRHRQGYRINNLSTKCATPPSAMRSPEGAPDGPSPSLQGNYPC